MSTTSLAHKTAVGFFWLVSQAIASRLLSLLSQYLLAWWLLREDFGLIGAAMTITTVIEVLQQLGVRDVLIQRQHNLRRWLNAGFWMTLTAGLLAAALMALAAGGLVLLRVWVLHRWPHATSAYLSPHLPYLILIIAASSPFAAAAAIPSAILQVRLQFGTATKIGVSTMVLSTALTIAMALLGWGAFSVVVPRLVVSIVMLVPLWLVTRPPIRFRFQARRWWFIFGDSAYQLGAGMLYNLTNQGDNMIFGALYSEAILGPYFFAFSLATQSYMLLASNLGSVLLPVLSQVKNDPERQTRAFLRVARVLALVGIPMCLLQAALAGPVLRLFFPPRWAPAIPLLAILSIGLSVRVIYWPTGGLMSAQGRFREVFWQNLIYVGLFFPIVAVGAYFGAALGVAIAVATLALTIEPLFLYQRVWKYGGRWSDLVAAAGPPLLISLLALSPLLFAWKWLPSTRGGDVIRLALSLLVGVPVYIVGIRIARPDACRELAERFSVLSASIRRRLRPQGAVQP